MCDTSEQTGDRTEATADGDVSRREVLSKSGAGVGFAIWQSGWWGSGDDGGGSGGWWGGGDDGGDNDGGWWGDDGDDGGDGGTGGGDDIQKPVIFVHGGQGSGTQWESQALRFSSNGYPDDHLALFEYNSTAYGSDGLLGGLLGGGNTTDEQVYDDLDQQIDDLLAETGHDQVYALGHSLGTDVLISYMQDSARAAKVAKYVNLDGASNRNPAPGDTETLAVNGMEDKSDIPNAESVSLPDQSHVQVATSEETFAEVYEFLLEEEPETTQIEVETADEITLSGRAQIFPSNQPPEQGTQVDVFEIDPNTGERLSDQPVASPTVDSNGDWGPIEVDGSQYHEFRLTDAVDDQTHHHYRFPELRSNQFVHLLTSTSGSGIDSLIEKSDDHAALVAIRDKEFWGDQGASGDRLEINGTNVLNATTAAQSSSTIGAFVYDAGSDGQTNLNSQPSLFGVLPFMSGIDHYMPASSPPDGTVDLVSTPRGGNGLQRSISIPNYASSMHRESIYFPDHTQTR